MSNDNLTFLEWINQTSVTKDELILANNAANERREELRASGEEPCYEATVGAILRAFDVRELGSYRLPAIMARMEALSWLLQDGGLSESMVRTEEDGSSLLSEAAYAAAAEARLHDVANRWTFDPAQFRAIALRQTEGGGLS